METIVKIILVMIVVSISLFYGNILSLILPRINKKVFDHKPFNCRPCFTFHLTWFLCSLLALLFKSIPLLVSGVIIAFIVFVIVRYIDNKKIVE